VSRIRGLIVAGGAGTRLGGPKAFLPFRGVPLLLRVARRLEKLAPEVHVAGPPALIERLAAFRYPVDADAPGVSGPLAGLLAGCRAAAAAGVDRVVAVAVDLPFLEPALLAEELRLALDGRYDAVLPGPGPESDPLHAVYAPAAIASAAAAAAAAGRSALVDALLAPAISVRWLAAAECARFDARGLSRLNVNSPEDLDAAEALDV